jgi:formate-dependent nitrite reductase membrane component NrfD
MSGMAPNPPVAPARGKPMAEPWRGQTYHGRPALKPAAFDWKVATYILAQGIAGASQVIAGLSRAQGGGRDGLVRRVRVLAATANLAGTAVLVGHLKTPKRFYNMLRIVRPTSPMSWGSWMLAAFGAVSTATALADLFGGRSPRLRRAADAMQVPASLAGAGMSVYTASLLSATSNPLWAAAPAPLAASFGAASFAGAGAALALLQRHAGETASAERLERLSAVAALAEAAADRVARAEWRRAGVEAPISQGTPGLLHGPVAQGLGVALPVALHAIRLVNRAAHDRVAPAASLALLVGDLALRHAVLRAGDVSAARPRDHFASQRERRRHVRR